MTLLAIYAHPDDEAFGTGGTLARYAASGVDVRLICATRGESGKITDPDIDPASDLATLREGELREACRHLGIGEPIFLGYHDSGRHERTRYDDPKALMNVDEFELEEALLPWFERLRPQVLLTFDPHGGYGHIDHIRIQRAATAAFWSSGNLVTEAPRRLFYNAMPLERMRRLQEARRNGPMDGLDPARYAVSEDSFAAVLDVGAFMDVKERAIRAHRSQVGPRSSFAAREDQAEGWRAFMERETFTLGGVRGAFPAPPVGDLFAGL
ncbi:MAG TPA: PIG-L deacetylase family protein [Trueperaceae bacterium]|nr:PIG-L deacetylase family protein [Trueperaceae bacterium]